MLKKRAAILFITLAYAILLCHNFVPHQHYTKDFHQSKIHDHHHHSGQSLTKHHHNDQPSVGGEDSGNFNLFSHFIHTTGDYASTNNHTISIAFSTLLISVVATLPDSFSFSHYKVPPLRDKPPSCRLIYHSAQSLPSGLRAPPLILS